MTAMIRNLGKMTNLGVFEDPANVKIVTDMLGNGKHLSKARIHPIKVNCYNHLLSLWLIEIREIIFGIIIFISQILILFLMLLYINSFI